MTERARHSTDMKRQALPAALFAGLVATLIGLGAAGAIEGPVGFGNIPFGSSTEDALKHNNGNGVLTRNPDKSAILTYQALVAGLDFQVVQNFDTNGRATDAVLTYTSLEQPNDCIGRFNFILGLLTNQYGKPSVIPAMQHEVRGLTSFDRYPYEFAMSGQSAVKAQLEVSYPTPQRNGSKTASTGPAKAPATGCQITLNYLPPGWVAHL